MSSGVCRACTFPLLFGHGIHKEAEIVDLGVQFGALSKSGGIYRLTDAGDGFEANLLIGKSRADTIQAVTEQPDLAALVAGRVREAAMASPDAAAPVETSAEVAG